MGYVIVLLHVSYFTHNIDITLKNLKWSLSIIHITVTKLMGL